MSVFATSRAGYVWQHNYLIMQRSYFKRHISARW